MPLITRICWSVFHKVDTIFCLKPSLSFEYERWLCVSVVDRTNLSAGVLHLRLPFMTQLKRSVLRWINSVKKFYIHSWAFLVCLCVCYNLLMCVCRFLLKGFSRQPCWRTEILMRYFCKKLICYFPDGGQEQSVLFLLSNIAFGKTLYCCFRYRNIE